MAFYIEVFDLWKVYGNVTALRGISFKIDRSGVVGLIGPNGAGKTTLIRILSCQLKQTSGRAFVLGYEVGKDDYEIKKRIALLPQGVKAHYYLLDPFDYIYHYLRIRGLSRREAKLVARRAMEEFDIDFWYRNVVELSEGMVRKTLLAMVLSYDAQIYFLDEPTAGLDPSVRISFWEKLREKSRDSLIFITSHYMDKISTLCDEVLLLDKGCLIGRGSPEEVARRFVRKYRKKVVALGRVDELGYHVKVVGRYTYVYLESESEINEVTSKLMRLGLPFRIEDVTIEDYFILGEHEWH